MDTNRIRNSYRYIYIYIYYHLFNVIHVLYPMYTFIHLQIIIILM